MLVFPSCQIAPRQNKLRIDKPVPEKKIKKINEAKHTGSFLPQMKYNQPPSWRDLIYGWSNSNWVFNQVCFGKRCGKVYLGKIFSEILNLSSIISPWHSLWLWVSAGSVELCVTWHVSKLTGCGMLALSNQSGLSARLSGNAKVTQVIRKEKALKNTHVALHLECCFRMQSDWKSTGQSNLTGSLQTGSTSQSPIPCPTYPSLVIIHLHFHSKKRMASTHTNLYCSYVPLFMRHLFQLVPLCGGSVNFILLFI